MTTRKLTSRGSTWRDRDPARYERDLRDVTKLCPDLEWVDDEAGGWDGRLPLWPFDRPAPTGLLEHDMRGLRIELRYLQAYPMVAPAIRPLDPEPALREWTVHAWHVNGDGSLCLLQSTSSWDPQASITELLLKAAGWRIEYALMKAGLIETMSVTGIVSEGSHDQLIRDFALKSVEARGVQ